jgi:tRNA (guanine37-N1)-methyltransferase
LYFVNYAIIQNIIMSNKKVAIKNKKITFHAISIFPKMVESYVSESMLEKGREKGLLDFKFYDMRDYAEGKHKKVDDRPYAGGPGMLMYAEPILKCVDSIREVIKERDAKSGSKSKVRVILFKPKGDKFDNVVAHKYAKSCTDIILICGRYEGIDSRVEKILKPDIVSVGDYILTGGEVPAMIVIDAVSRQCPGVLGDIASLEESRGGFDEFYTRPEVLVYKNKKYKVPEILLSGDPKKIAQWRADKGL